MFTPPFAPRCNGPMGSGRVHVVRLVFSLRGDGRTRITGAAFCLGLSRAAMVLDAFPREQTVAQDRSVTLEFGPSLKLADKVEVALGTALRGILEGERNPDLDDLPLDMAEAVRGLLGRLRARD